MLGCLRFRVHPGTCDPCSRSLLPPRVKARVNSLIRPQEPGACRRKFPLCQAADSGGSQSTREKANNAADSGERKSLQEALVQRAMAWSFGEKVVAAVAAAGILWAIPRLLLFSLAQMEGVAVIALIGVEEAVAALLLLAFRYLAIGGLFVLAATVVFLVVALVAKKAFGRDN
ncbi:hypothetical protein WJX74_008398 [Apatococcus lobatus]|uniref:Uncharacterized protein n=1 Tax=Apatococcus lobatus TaxID=904363 RepID=A0AAW1RMX1_9CHLO